jgi:hypothetical protein
VEYLKKESSQLREYLTIFGSASGPESKVLKEEEKKRGGNTAEKEMEQR